jgi:high frequency lysogenization protein
MHYRDSERIIALGGVFQSVHLVQQLATRGYADEDELETSLRSLLTTDAASVREAYPAVLGLAPGLNLLHGTLGKGQGRTRDMDTSRYIIALIHLEKKLSSNRPMLAHIAEGIERVRGNLEHFPILHGNITAQLADIYLNSLSKLTPRIMIKGEPNYLKNPEIANRIRSSLLAGIRSAMLWRQIGGKRRHILFFAGRLAIQAQRLLAEPEQDF